MKNKRIAFLLFLFLSFNASAQYFGQNKVNYKSFDFKELWTPHFKILHYESDLSPVVGLGQYAERWYDLHQHIFADPFGTRNPIILYANHGDFQQSVTIGGRIGVGTGGVTEGLRNRVVIPMLMTENQSNHVLGHELVHVFQYRLFKNDSTLGFQQIENVPLWMIEGMAEFLSIGRTDGHTALWMRDAVASDDIPTLKDMSQKPDEYFPYRYGEAFWAFVVGHWGDEAVLSLLRYTGRYGIQKATDSLFGISNDSLSVLWKNSLKKYYGRFQDENFDAPPGKVLINEKNGGEMNISPNLSPDGKYLVFISEKDIFSTDYYLADAESGMVIRKIASSTKEGHIDAFNFLESGGCWSPDSRQFAFIVYSKGRNVLKIVDALSGKNILETPVPGYESLANPTWSPDGETIVMTAQRGYSSDLIAFHLSDRKVTRLTDDVYAAITPSFSPDGRFIAYSSDRLSRKSDYPSASQWYNIALYDMKSHRSTDLPLFEGAMNVNPVFSHDGLSLYFLSNRDGFRNLYEYKLEEGKIYRMTHLFTGITGITEMAPAISSASSADRFAYIYYHQRRYEIYSAESQDFKREEVSPTDISFEAGMLPPVPPVPNAGVTARIHRFHKWPGLPASAFEEHPYRPEFKLEYIGNTEIGISTSAFGTGASGGVSMLFGDIIGFNKLFTALNVNGDIQDAAGQVYYLNQKNRIHWGLGLSHIPVRYGSIGYRQGIDTISGTPILTDQFIYNTFRIFEDQINADIQYPINRTQRLEFGASVARYYYQQIVELYEYTLTGILLKYEKNKVPVPKGFNLYHLMGAWVGDNSYFGIASPMKGYRYRLEADRVLGPQQYWGLLADGRKYFWLKPMSFAFRTFNILRPGLDNNDYLSYPLFAGDPTLVHGYYSYFFSNRSSFPIQTLLGNNIHVVNAEWRVSLSGPKQLALIRSRYFLTELALFADAGLAWNRGDQIFSRFADIDPDIETQRAPVFSTGLALRINFFGQLVLEPYYAFPLQDPTYRRGRFGLNISPGW